MTESQRPLVFKQTAVQVLVFLARLALYVAVFLVLGTMIGLVLLVGMSAIHTANVDCSSGYTCFGDGIVFIVISAIGGAITSGIITFGLAIYIEGSPNRHAFVRKSSQ